mmetsp:Transcript_116835/g.203269  ORF Transcript_116835/g.203269 Transcript_116835/m.203269 type:complete len:204 (-) Transcript_116835:475-1086(-)
MTTSSTSLGLSDTSSMTFLTSAMHSSNRDLFSCSNLALDTFTRRSSPSWIESTSISVTLLLDRARFAFSHAVRNLRTALAFSDMSSLVCFLNSCIQYFTKLSSKSWPPRCVFPLVALTSKTGPSIAISETSKVPPPKSKTRTFLLSYSSTLSKPYAKAAAVGSLIMRATCRPASSPATFVQLRCASLKCAGTVMTALVTFFPR